MSDFRLRPNRYYTLRLQVDEFGDYKLWLRLLPKPRLFGNQLRWAKSVIQDALAQWREK